jgi:hypothetical protein
LQSKEVRVHIKRKQEDSRELAGASLAGPGQDLFRNLGALSRVLAFFRPDFASLCPDLVNETERGLQRRP